MRIHSFKTYFRWEDFFFDKKRGKISDKYLIVYLLICLRNLTTFFRIEFFKLGNLVIRFIIKILDLWKNTGLYN